MTAPGQHMRSAGNTDNCQAPARPGKPALCPRGSAPPALHVRPPSLAQPFVWERCERGFLHAKANRCYSSLQCRRAGDCWIAQDKPTLHTTLAHLRSGQRAQRRPPYDDLQTCSYSLPTGQLLCFAAPSAIRRTAPKSIDCTRSDKSSGLRYRPGVGTGRTQ
ncbi:hypothetical protein K523DRAFT_125226 [Schizophyllum commune Tattone D]|nr:hypothetical protein K523DRAFT_125226 [Schizophyllum commune Tattone D]